MLTIAEPMREGFLTLLGFLDQPVAERGKPTSYGTRSWSVEAASARHDPEVRG